MFTHTQKTTSLFTEDLSYWKLPSMSNLAATQSSWNLGALHPLDKYPWQSKSQSICSLAGTLSNANVRDTSEVLALCGYFLQTVPLPSLPAGGAVLVWASWWRRPHLLSQPLPFTFSPSALASCYSLKRLGIISPQETGNMWWSRS